MAESILSQSLMGLNVPATENYWGIGASTLGEVAPKLINPYGKVGTNLAVGLGSVLLTALLGYQARQTAAEESITTNKLANELMSLRTPEERVARIESAKDELAPRLTSRLLQFNTALGSQERANALEVAKARQLEEAKLGVEMGPLGQQAFDRQMQRIRETQNLIGGRQFALEEQRQTNKLERDAMRAQAELDAKKAGMQLKQLVDAGKLPAKVREDVATAIDFGNSVESIIDEFDLETMSPLEYKIKMANTGFSTALRRALIQRVQPYRIAVTGMAAGKAEDRDIQIVFGQAPFSGPEEFIKALRSLKEAAATKADASLASASLRPADLYAGIQKMRVPGGRFSYAPLKERYAEIEDLTAGQPSEVAPNTVAPTPTPSAPTDAEFVALQQRLENSKLTPEQKQNILQQALARRGT